MTILTKTCRVCGGADELDASDVDLDNKLNQGVLRWWRNAPCEHCIAEQERAQKLEAIHKDHDLRLARSGLPEPFRALTFDELDRSGGREEPILAAESWANGSTRLIFLQSRPGTGKTRLAATATASALWKRQVYWTNAPALFRQAQADFKSQERKTAEAVMFSKAAIVLDDLGNENPTAGARQALQTLLEHRLVNNSRIFITSNLTVPQLAVRYEDANARGGDWLASRLATFEQYVLPGIDRRLELPL